VERYRFIDKHDNAQKYSFMSSHQVGKVTPAAASCDRIGCSSCWHCLSTPASIPRAGTGCVLSSPVTSGAVASRIASRW